MSPGRGFNCRRREPIDDIIMSVLFLTGRPERLSPGRGSRFAVTATRWGTMTASFDGRAT